MKKGAPNFKGVVHQHVILPNFPKKFMELRDDANGFPEVKFNT